MEEWNVLYPKDKQPTLDEAGDYIGKEFNHLWKKLLEHINSEYGVRPKWSYSTCSGKPGWNIKLQKGGKSFGTVYPEQGYFEVFIVIGHKLDEMVKDIINELSTVMRDRYENAQDYMKMGKWMMFPVKNETDLKDYLLLISVKKENR